MNAVWKSLIGLVLLISSGQSSAQKYYVIELSSELASQLQGVALNDAGQVTGTFLTLASESHAFLYSKGVLQDLGTLGGGSSGGAAINFNGQISGSSYLAPPTNYLESFITGPNGNGMTNLGDLGGIHESVGFGVNTSGQVVGYTSTAGGSYNAFITSSSGSGMTDIGTLGGSESEAYAINDSGQVTGTASLATVGNHAFITGPNGVGMTDLGTLGGSYSQGLAINATGQITGSASLAGNATQVAFVTMAGGINMTSIGTLGGLNSYGLSINDSGVVVGKSYLSGNATEHAFVYSNQTMTDLNSLIDPQSALAPYITLTQATGINASGVIIAGGTDSRFGNIPETFLLSTSSISFIPTVTPEVSGTLGLNGWYVSTAQLSWVVTGVPTPTSSGCNSVSISDSKGTTYTCSATNSVGTATKSLLIKQDTVHPQVTVHSPAKGKVYPLNALVVASYTCLDATSGIATCVGTVKNSANVPTSVPGTYTFRVKGTDKAGNKTRTSFLYSVK